MKTALLAAALVAVSLAAWADQPDFKSYIGTVTCTGTSDVEWASPEDPSHLKDNQPMTIMIDEKRDWSGWKLTGDVRFEVKRWTRKTTDGYPAGSVGWDTDGFWVGIFQESEVSYTHAYLACSEC
jgi:hypothetical protein